MGSTSGRWLALFLTAVLGCSSEPATVACTPACRAGYSCVAGACVSACNPACGAGERCVTSGATPACVPETDAGAPPADVPAVADVVTATDLPPGADAPAAMDAVTPADAPAPTDVTQPTSDLPPLPPCGRAGQVCCGNNACYDGGVCASGMCMAITRDTGECARPEDCPAGQSCIGVNECTGGRGCFRCGAPGAAATGEIGTACMGSAACRTGVCSNGRCSIPCPVGDAGDAQCNTARAGYVCTNILYRGTMSAPLTTLGVCNQACRRNADCPTGFVCGPLLNYLADRMDFVCRPASTTSTTPIGGACNPSMPTCQNVLCLPTGMTTGYCTGLCVTESDCTPEAPVCDTLYVVRPSGREQVTRGCHPRR